VAAEHVLDEVPRGLLRVIRRRVHHLAETAPLVAPKLERVELVPEVPLHVGRHSVLIEPPAELGAQLLVSPTVHAAMVRPSATARVAEGDARRPRDELRLGRLHVDGVGRARGGDGIKAMDFVVSVPAPEIE